MANDKVKGRRKKWSEDFFTLLNQPTIQVYLRKWNGSKQKSVPVATFNRKVGPVPFGKILFR